MSAGKSKKYAMISQPMTGIDPDVVLETRHRAVEKLTDMGYEVVKSTYAMKAPLTCRSDRLWYLSQALELMSKCDVLYCCKGWENSTGCKYEHALANTYGVPILYERPDYLTDDILNALKPSL